MGVGAAAVAVLQALPPALPRGSFASGWLSHHGCPHCRRVATQDFGASNGGYVYVGTLVCSTPSRFSFEGISAVPSH